MNRTGMTAAAEPGTAPATPSTGRAGAGAVCLVGGAVALALGRALATNGGTPVERLQQVVGHQTQVTASSLLAIAGFAALIPGFLAVAARVQRRGALLATIGGGVTVVGCAGFLPLVTVDGLVTVAATHTTSPESMADLLHQLDAAPALLVLGPLAAAGYFIGPFLVTLATRRAGLTSAWLPWGMLAALLLQPIGLVVAQGPGLALHLIDTACQLVLIAVTVVLARAVLTGPEPTD